MRPDRTALDRRHAAVGVVDDRSEVSGRTTPGGRRETAMAYSDRAFGTAAVMLAQRGNDPDREWQDFARS